MASPSRCRRTTLIGAKQYGGHVWLKKFDVEGVEAPVQAYVFRGLGSQSMFIVPDYGLVIARIASDFQGRGTKAMGAAVAKIIGAFVD